MLFSLSIDDQGESSVGLRSPSNYFSSEVGNSHFKNLSTRSGDFNRKFRLKIEPVFFNQ